MAQDRQELAEVAPAGLGLARVEEPRRGPRRGPASGRTGDGAPSREAIVRRVSGHMGQPLSLALGRLGSVGSWPRPRPGSHFPTTLAAFDVHKTGEFGGRAPEMDPGRGAGDRPVPEPAAPRGGHDILVSLSRVHWATGLGPGREDRVRHSSEGGDRVRMLESFPRRVPDRDPSGPPTPDRPHGVYPRSEGLSTPTGRGLGGGVRLVGRGHLGYCPAIPGRRRGGTSWGVARRAPGRIRGRAGWGSRRGRCRRWPRVVGPAAEGRKSCLAVLAGVVFLGFLGAVDLWGKREQRASAEAIDTVDHRALAGRADPGTSPAGEAPLPRWTIATLMRLTGRRDEWIVRLPGALAALGMVGLVYGLGRRLAGRSVGAGVGPGADARSPFFIAELRQAGNDGPLAFFTTLALYAAWRRLHGDGRRRAGLAAEARARRRAAVEPGRSTPRSGSGS